MRTTVATLLTLLSLAASSSALEPEPDAAFIRIADLGNALCCIAVIPGAERPRYMIYDAGGGATARMAISQLIPEGGSVLMPLWHGSPSRGFTTRSVAPLFKVAHYPEGSIIDVLVISHSDSDHLRAVPFICENYHVLRVLRARYDRTRDEDPAQVNSDAWKAADQAIRQEVRENFASSHPTVDYTLDRFAFPRGAEIPLGQATAVAVFGKHIPPDEWGLDSDESKRRNAGSIVVRLDFDGPSVLFTGDTVGRMDNDPASTILAAEKAMVDAADEVSLESDVMIAPHHGGSTPFIEAVDPSYVIFSAGRGDEHPTAAAAQRYLDHGIPADRLLRTDLGDNEGGKEWSYGTCIDGDELGDDDVDILIRRGGELVAEYQSDSPLTPPSPLRLVGRAIRRALQPGVNEPAESRAFIESVRGDRVQAAAGDDRAMGATTITIENVTIEQVIIHAKP